MKINKFAAALALATTSAGALATSAQAAPAASVVAPASACTVAVRGAFGEARNALYTVRVLSNGVHRERLLVDRIAPLLRKDLQSKHPRYRNVVLRSLRATNLWPKLSRGLKQWIAETNRRAERSLGRVFASHGQIVGATGVLSLSYPSNAGQLADGLMGYAYSTTSTSMALAKQLNEVVESLDGQTCLPATRGRIVRMRDEARRHVLRMLADARAIEQAVEGLPTGEHT